MFTFKKEKINFIGLGLLVLSFTVFLITGLSDSPPGRFLEEGKFLFHYIIALIYLGLCLAEKIIHKLKFFKFRMGPSMISLSLFWVSCFALNRELPIFYEAIDWFSVIIFLCTLIFLLPAFVEIHDQNLRILFSILSAITSIVLVYYSVFLIPFYPIGAIGMIAIGLGGHVFIPVAMFIYWIFVVKEYLNSSKQLIAFLSTIAVAIIGVTIYTFQYQNARKELSNTIDQASIQTEIPRWAYVSQNLPSDYFSQLVLKQSITSAHFRFFRNDFGFPHKELDDVKRHDPLIIIADLVSPTRYDDNLSRQEKLKVLLSNHKVQHQREEKLWDGDDLKTHSIKTTVDLFPQYRMAYTEKTFQIKNTRKNRRWGNQQEAIYQFHLAEGTVVTSLSLWVNGIEEKAILTTKEKAEEAYKTIVGRERRDPSLVTWREGNIVSVRVFPCTPELMRQVKIGFTAPLRLNDDKLFYESVDFEGPSAKHAQEKITITSSSPITSTSLDLATQNDQHLYYGDYIQDWNVSMNNVAISPTPFTFNNQSYTVKKAPKTEENTVIKEAFIDLTNKWTKEELLQVIRNGKIKYYGFVNNKKLEITAKNVNSIVSECLDIQFGLFPFHKLKDHKNSIVITKGGDYSIKLHQLKNSNFYDQLKEWKSSSTIKVFLINNQLTPYQKALHELRSFQLMTGNMKQLQELLYSEKFRHITEDENTIAIHQADIIIQKESATTSNSENVPDHIMRLYAYNSILRDISKSYFSEDYITDNLIKRAKEAYVVSPISSLIVLETQQDYDRFDIEDTENSLKNASSSGAAPEPHEWALIMIVMIGLAYFFEQKYSFIKRFKKSSLS